MWTIILLLITLIYLLTNIILPTLHITDAYLLTPLLYLILALTTLSIANHQKTNILKYQKTRTWTLGNSPIHAGLLIAGFQLALLIIIGLFTGFGKSPYAFTPTTLAYNITYVTTFLLGTELSRTYLIKKGTHHKKHTTTTLALTTLLFVIIRITPSNLHLLTFTDPPATLEFLGATILTAIAINLLASYLAYLGGATAAISYTGVLLAFEWFSPILPNPHWTMLALVGTIAPAIGYTLIQQAETHQIKKKKHHHRTPHYSEHSWTALAIFSVLIVFFSFGYLGVTPTVIYSGSMQPTLHVGDIVLIQKTTTDHLQEGDIIQYTTHNTTYVHRIHTITTTPNHQTQIITKGDANDDPDTDPITPNQILGKSRFIIPYLGWIQITIKSIIRTLGIPF